MLTRASLEKLLTYTPETGAFHRNGSGGGRSAGTQAGTKKSANGYVYISVRGSRQLAHRLAFIWMTGAAPAGQVDHINGDRSDNRWSNLRLATVGQNAANTKPHRDSASGVKGIYLHKASGRWHATIMVDGRKRSLGYFPTPDQAHAAYAAAAVEAHGEYARTA